ncbi:hypothetical protein [Acinetobacter pittii]|uniref:hypothetical protein n=1 Tax=Acinetobacter pittii TaxID=48296 RepID=UPI00300D3C7C
MMKKVLMMSMCSALLFLAGCNKTSQQDQAVSKEQKTTEQKATQKQDSSCLQIMAATQKINQNSRIEDLNQINEKLKSCVPSLKNDEQLKLIDASTAMYQRFLKQDYTENTGRAFETFGYAVLEQKQDLKKVIQTQKKLFDQLSPRDQYLLQYEGQAYIELLYQGEGMFTYRRQPNYLVDVFSKALPADQKEFLTRMAKDNQDIFYNDGALAVSWKELTERALFWEKFIQKYPKSHFISDAKRLFNEYRYFIFFGLDNTPVSDEYAPNTWFDKDALQQIRFLSTQNQSSLAKPAQQFLKFITTPVEERNKQFKIGLTDKNGDKKSNYQITHEQLEQLLKFDSPWNTEVYRDCHMDAVCIDTN